MNILQMVENKFNINLLHFEAMFHISYIYMQEKVVIGTYRRSLQSLHKATDMNTRFPIFYAKELQKVMPYDKSSLYIYVYVCLISYLF